MTTPLLIVILEYVAYFLLLLIAGALEYLHELPANSTNTVFLLILGALFRGVAALPSVQAIVANTRATKENTAVTASSQASALVTPDPQERYDSK